jgi:hypothetical protein
LVFQVVSFPRGFPTKTLYTPYCVCVCVCVCKETENSFSLLNFNFLVL